ncbi:hypothetical protein [Mucilaginibacter dorajii]|uniref:hypothetical protein n=1 Tax=Mucilaginibacter dorajii TaxID=692994 RepID=UPI002168A3AC|nr:hypothetical protein [Mucilaginibacter dorajii]MCS3737699.1 hypothetical protein [Mucilaginibacter dorajii]
MKKFYFLNKDKQWQGPYWFPRILLFALNGTIEPATYVWNDKLATDIGSHPENSIYARLKASEYRSLPMWVFGYNLKILITNATKRMKTTFQKKDDWETIAAKPIEISSILEEASKVYLVPSITAIHDFAAPGEYAIKLIYIDTEQTVKLSEYPIALSSDNEPGIKFEITMVEPPEVGGVQHKESYGLHRSLGIFGKNENIAVVKNSVFDFSTRFPYKPQILKGRFRQASLVSANDYKNRYNRLVLKIADDKITSPQSILDFTGMQLYDHEKFNVHGSLMGLSFKTGGSYTEVIIAGIHYHFYTVTGDILIIDGRGREDLEDFKLKAEIIKIAFAVISGKYYGGTCNYVTSEDTDFRQIDGLWYEMQKESILSERQLINLPIFRRAFEGKDDENTEKQKAFDGPVDPTIFSGLCEALYNDETLLHAANLVISAMGNNDPLQQGALYSVALETLTATLGEAKSAELKPITNKPISRAFVAELKAVLATYEGRIPAESLDILRKNIEGINRPTNRDKLVKTFEIYGIMLSNEDKETIDKRNDYLHGRNPLDMEHIFELTQISLRLHTLIVALLLKSIGYSGHIVNLDIHLYLTNEEKMVEMIKEGQETAAGLINQIEQAKEERDEAKFNAAKAELGRHIENNKIGNLIRII